MKNTLLVIFSTLLICTRLIAQGPVPQVPRITDLFSAEEAKRAGLAKLTPEEITALNSAFFRLLAQLNSQPNTQSGKRTSDEDTDLYDSGGIARVYIDGEDDDLNIFLWTGQPVAYIDDDSIYGFNGKHLGWWKDGLVYDHEGHVVVATADQFREGVTSPPPKPFKQFLPFKSFKEFKPFVPFFSPIWSRTPARVFFLQGVN